MTDKFEALIYSVQGGIATISLNRPKYKNAFNPADALRAGRGSDAGGLQ